MLRCQNPLWKPSRFCRQVRAREAQIGVAGGRPNPTGLAVHPAGSYLYAANQPTNTISMFTMAASGCLTAGLATSGVGILQQEFRIGFRQFSYAQAKHAETSGV
jgi:DNA-binding beta-propeller fold protein YncE